MKGKACSWRDMRRIKHILEKQPQLKGEYEALTNCVDRTTVATWKRSIEVMDALNSRDLSHTQPTHAREIARLSPKEEWSHWVECCEAEGWTVSELRGKLLEKVTAETHEKASLSTPTGLYRTIVIDPPWSYGNKSGRQRQQYADRTMSLDQIKNFDLSRWLPEDSCHLYLWITDVYAGRAFEVLDSC